MEYTTRMGSGPRRAHVNYQCPCGCIGGVIYNADKPLSKAGACCCGRKLWVGENAEDRVRAYLEAGIAYDWDLGTVALPWGDVVPAAMAWPREAPSPLEPEAGGIEAGADAKVLVRDVVCAMTIDPATAAGTSQYRGKPYYFCAAECKRRFDAEPERFVRKASLLERLRGRA